MADQPHAQPIIELQSVSKSFDGKPIITQLTLQVNNGEFLTILGPSGCGKTTVLRLIAGLTLADQGIIRLAGHNITQLPAEQRPINTVFQSYALFPHMSIFDNVAFGLRMQKTAAAELQARVIQALQMMHVDDLAQRYPQQLSGGQQQRVAIARALVNRPKVLLLDESLSALDQKLRKTMQNELKAWQRELGITFILVTHDQEEALAIADRLIVMRDGNIEQQGTPREIYEEPCNLFVAQFIGESNLFEAQTLYRIDEERIRANVQGYECTLLFRHPVQPQQPLKVLLRPEDLRITEIHDNQQQIGLVGYVRERNYKGMTLDSIIELENGQRVMVSEFFNEDDPNVDHSLNQKVAVTWVESWEVVLTDESTS
ncbi:MAG: spermidine/putrescine ABC transporter ATP-binding protein PotA [Candidatus Symbiodolus clandestinus]